MYFPNYYKVVEEKYLEVNTTDILVNKNEDFHDNVSFIKNKLCSGQWEEITRKEFDAFYKKTVSKINELSKL